MVTSKENVNNHLLTLKSVFNTNSSSTSVKSASKELLQDSAKSCTRMPFKELNLNHSTENKKKEIIVDDEICSANNLVMTPERRERLKRLSLTKVFNLQNRLHGNGVNVAGNEKKGSTKDTTIDENKLSLESKSKGCTFMFRITINSFFLTKHI